MWCDSCRKDTGRPSHDQGKVCCSFCGVVLAEDNFAEEATFVKNAAGQSQLSGNFVKSVQNKEGISAKTYNDAHDGIEDMMYSMGMDGGSSLSSPALRLFTLLVERNFTRGRRKELVQASCLYISCRLSMKPYLLIDFSEHLGINVYVLGTVFLQICKNLSLVEHDFVQKPVDPSLFIHRFTDRLCGGQNHKVSMRALKIIASMKRDWMQTGRKPSGLCGAALYISSLSYGIKCSKSDIIKVVHVCEATLTKRLIEFENTESGSLTIEEFKTRSDQLEEDERNREGPAEGSGNSEFMCKHNDTGEAPFAHGLCKECYDDLIKISGGLSGGSEPPAFQRAQLKRVMAKEASSAASAIDDSSPLDFDEQRNTGNTSQGANAQNDDGMQEDSETLSDVDDVEVDVYLHTEEEKQLKKIVWEEMNKEYLEEQAIKEEAEKAAREAYEARLANCSEEERAALELNFAAKAAAAKSQKDKRQKRAADVKASGPPRTAAEATKQMLEKKRLSSKIRYDVLHNMFDESENLDTNKKSRTEPKSDHEENYMDNSIKDDPEVDQDIEYNNVNDKKKDYLEGEEDFEDDIENTEDYIDDAEECGYDYFDE